MKKRAAACLCSVFVATVAEAHESPADGSSYVAADATVATSYPEEVAAASEPYDEGVGYRATVVGVRPSWHRGGFEDGDRSGFGVGAWALSYAAHTVKFLTASGGLEMGIGGGDGGLEGRFAGHLTVGLLARFDEFTGIFARVGVGGSIEGNDRAYVSELEFPRGEVGYQVMEEDFALEIGPRLGASLTGRFSPVDARHVFGPDATYGAAMSVRAGPVAIRLSGMRVESFYAPTHGSAFLCVGEGLAVCADGRLWHAAEAPAEFGPRTVAFAGITLGGGDIAAWTPSDDDDHHHHH